MGRYARFDRLLIFVAASLPPAVVLVLLAVTFWTSLVTGTPRLGAALTLQNYAAVYGDPFTYGALLNTVWFAGLTACVAMAFGVPIAWLAERTDLPAKPLLFAAMVIGLVMPTFLVGMGWVLMLHPRIGFLNIWLRELSGASQITVNIASIPGMGFVEGLSLAPLGFIMTAAAFRAMNPMLEDAAQVHGLGRVAIFRRVTLPLAAPALVAAAIYIFIIGVGAFDVPAVIGLANRIYTFSTLIYVKAMNPDNGVIDYGIPAAVGALMLALAVVLTVWYGRYLRASSRYQQISGRGYQPRLIALGRWRFGAWGFCAFYLALSIGLPLLLVTWASLLPFLQPPSIRALKLLSLAQFRNQDWELIARGARNTAALMLLVPTVTVFLAVPIAWVIVRSRSRARFLYEFLVFLPQAMPAMIFGLAALLAALFVLKGVVPLYGTIWLIAIVYIVERMTFCSRVMNNALLQIHHELDEAAYTGGLSLLDVLRRIIVPLMLPSILGVWLWSALISFRELTIAAVLFGRESVTLPVVVWNLWTAGGMGRSGAVTLIMLGFMLPLVLFYWAVAGRRYL